MSDQLLAVLKLCLLALLYLFFLRVLWAVWAQTRPARVREVGPVATRSASRVRTARRSATAPDRLRVIEPAPLAGREFPLGDELTVGRAAGCQITLDDTFVSQLHARVFRRESQYLVEDLGSTNGTYLNRGKVAGPMVIQPGDRLQVGNTVMELA